MITLRKYVKLANLLDNLEYHKEAEQIDALLEKIAGDDTSYAADFLARAQANYQDLLRLLPANMKSNPALNDVLKRLDTNLRLVQKELIMLSKDASLELEMEKEVEVHEDKDGDKDADDKDEGKETKKKKITLSFD